MVLAGPSMPCTPCIAFCLAVPKMLFREHLCARFWHRLGLESCWGSGVSQPCPRCSTRRFHGTGRSIQTSMALPCMPSIFALYCIVCLEFSGSEDAISRASLRTLLAPPWAWILLRIRCFATMPHNAPHGVSMVLAGPSGHLWLCLLCLFESISAHAPGTALRLIRCFATMPTLLHRAFPWYWPVHPDIYGFAFYALYALYCLLFSSSEDAISRASLRTLLAPSGVESCWGSGVSQPCPTVFHSAFPWYWPVHLCLVRLVLPSV